MQAPSETPVEQHYKQYREEKQQKEREKAEVARKIGWGSDYCYVFVPMFFRSIAAISFVAAPIVLLISIGAADHRNSPGFDFSPFALTMILGVVAGTADILIQTSARTAEALTKIVESQSRKKAS